jgi:hypothetical protein
MPPGRNRSPANRALDDRILAVLRDAHGFPLSTVRVRELAGIDRALPEVRARLRYLQAHGLVARVTMPGWVTVWWVAVPQPQPNEAGGRDVERP